MAVAHPADKSLRAYHLGHLDPELAETIKAHIDTCPNCQSRIKTMTLAGGPLEARRATLSAATKPKATVAEALASRPSGATTNPAPSIPDYNIVRVLGEGGMGVVYLARNTLTQREEALKVLSSHLVDQPRSMERFLQEIQAAVRLDHRNIVRSYTALRVEGSLILVMEYVEGEDLFEHVERRGPLPVGEACFYAFQVAQGLQHAHERGMVHRDIKPHNLIVTNRDGKRIVKILDFGLAKVTSEGPVDGGITRHGAVIGTADYISPEQIRNARLADIRADIYSLGCTLYYLLNGAPPFAGANSLYDIFQAHHSQDATALNQVRQDVPVELAALVGKMMAKDADARFQTPGEAAAALRQFLPSTTAPQSITSSPRSVVSAPRRRDATVVEQVSRPKDPALDRLVTVDEEVLDLRPRIRNEPKLRPVVDQKTKEHLLIGASALLAAILVIGGTFVYLGSTKDPAVGSAPAGEAKSKIDLAKAPATEPTQPAGTENWASRGPFSRPNPLDSRNSVAPGGISNQRPSQPKAITVNEVPDSEDIKPRFEASSEDGPSSSSNSGDRESHAEVAVADDLTGVTPSETLPSAPSPDDLSYESAARNPRGYLGKTVTINEYWWVATNPIKAPIPDHKTLHIKDQNTATVVDGGGRAYGKYTLPVAFDPALLRVFDQFLSKVQVRNANLPTYRAIPTMEVRKVNLGGRDECFGAIVAMDFSTDINIKALNDGNRGEVFTVFRITPAGFRKLDAATASQLYNQLGGETELTQFKLGQKRAADKQKKDAITRFQMEKSGEMNGMLNNMIKGDNNRQNGINNSIRRGNIPR